MEKLIESLIKNVLFEKKYPFFLLLDFLDGDLHREKLTKFKIGNQILKQRNNKFYFLKNEVKFEKIDFNVDDNFYSYECWLKAEDYESFQNSLKKVVSKILKKQHKKMKKRKKYFIEQLDNINKLLK